jgi:hypothetical protein
LNNNTVASRMRPDAKHKVPELDSKVLRWTIDDITTSDHFAKQVSHVHFEFVLVAYDFISFSDALHCNRGLFAQKVLPIVLSCRLA